MNLAKNREKETDKVKTDSIATKRSILTRQIINIFYKEGFKTIAELCESTNNSIPSITNIINELARSGLVKNFGIGESKGGRKPVIFGLNPESGYIVSIELSRRHTRIGVFNLHNEQIAPIKEFDNGLNNTDDILSILKSECDEALSVLANPEKTVLGYGVTFPGLIDIKKGMSYSYPQFGDKPIEETFSNAFQKPVFVEHDTKAMVLGEAWFGLAKNKSNVLLINIGSGIGMGILISGEVYYGNSGLCGEFGHIQMNPDGELCYCGKVGCLETIASGTAMVKNAQEKIRNGKSTIISKLVSDNIEAITLKKIIEAARSGDLFAIELIEEAGEYLAKGLSVLIHLFNPETIIIGGEIADAGNLIIDPVQQKLNKYTMLRLKQDTTIVLSELREKSGLMGMLPIVVNKTLIQDMEATAV